MPLCHLHVKLDFASEYVLSAFHRNTSILYLYSGVHRGVHRVEMITDGPVFHILERNRRLLKANELLDCEPRMLIPLRGVWGKAIGHFARHERGATAVYKVLRERIVFWWAPKMTTCTTNDAVSASPATALASTSSSSLHTPPPQNSIPREKNRNENGRVMMIPRPNDNNNDDDYSWIHPFLFLLQKMGSLIEQRPFLRAVRR